MASLDRTHCPTSGSPSSSFLLLPIEVRQRIYTFAGLVRNCPINIETERTRWYKLRSAYNQVNGSRELFPTRKTLIEWHNGQEHSTDLLCAFDMKLKPNRREGSGMGCVHSAILVQILRVCKQIHVEATQWLWSKNTFILGPDIPFLPWLRLEILVSLEIQLTTCSCILDHECIKLHDYKNFDGCRFCHFGCKRGQGKPLSLHRQKDRIVLHRWRTFCADLRERCNTTLELTLICDCEDAATALKVTRSLQGFPILRHANIRLGQSPGMTLSGLARKAVQGLTGADETQPFPFMKLPSEIQYLVLKHTDLIAPSYLSWYEPVNDWISFRGNGVSRDRTYPGFWLLDDKQSGCCLQCTPSLEVCTCPSRHAAYSSHVCRCWQFPMALFLVNRSFNQQSTKIFFSHNRFVLWEATDHPADEAPSLPIHERLKTPLKFFQEIPQRHLNLLRWIRFTSRDFRCGEITYYPSYYDFWVMLTASIKQLPLSRLTFDLDLAGYGEYGWGFYVHGEWLADAYESLWRLVKLFKPSGQQRYENFFVRIAHSVDNIEDDWQRWRLEKQMENYIMGDDYDATARGKYLQRGEMRKRGVNFEYGYYDESLQPKRYLRTIMDTLPEDDIFFNP